MAVECACAIVGINRVALTIYAVVCTRDPLYIAACIMNYATSSVLNMMHLCVIFYATCMYAVSSLSAGQPNGSHPDCGIPAQVPIGGYITIENTTNGITVTYSCEQGLRLVGNNTSDCQLNGTWSGNTPLCLQDPASAANNVLLGTGVPTDTRDLNKEGSLNMQILTTATLISLLSVVMVAVIVAVLLHARQLMHKWRLMTRRAKRNRNSSAVINNPIYEGMVSY